jgi:hypothetical protein
VIKREVIKHEKQEVPSAPLTAECVKVCGLFCAEGIVRWLDSEVAISVASALAESTKSQYKGAEEIFLLFCLFVCGSAVFLPVSDHLLCRYLQWKSLTVDPKSLKTSLSAVRYLHERLGHGWVPITERFKVHRCLMGLKRRCCTPVKRKMAITPALLVQMRLCETIDWTHPWMVVMWGAMLMAFFCFLRKDNFTVQKAEAYNYQRHLARGDVQVGPTQLRLTLRHSKTNQFGAREHVALALAIPGCLLDPHRAVVQAFAVCPRATASDPAFAVPSAAGGRPTPLTHHMFMSMLRKCLLEIGVDASLYSGHSFRRGGATFAFRLGIHPLDIKRMGDWSSDAYMLYVELQTPEGLVRLPRALAAACAAYE